MNFGSLIIFAIVLVFYYELCKAVSWFADLMYMFFAIFLLGTITTGKNPEVVLVTGLLSVVGWIGVRRREAQDRYLNEGYSKEKVLVSKNANQTKQSHAYSDASGLPSYEFEHHKQDHSDNQNVQNDQAERIHKWREQAVLDAKKQIDIEIKKIRKHQQQWEETGGRPQYSRKRKK